MFGEQTPPCVQVAAHALARVMEHAPEVAQHLPGCGQGLGEHAPPDDHVPSHERLSVRLHAPSMVQQVPG